MAQTTNGRYAAPKRKRRRRRRNYFGPIFNILLLLTSGILLFSAFKLFTEEVQGSAETVPPDTAAPQIHGVQDFLIYAGDTVAYRSGVTITDDRDSAPQLTVDSSGVDLTTAGTYQVIYTAADAAGNTSTETAVVTVLEKREGYADLDTIYAAAEQKLGEILDEGASPEDQVRAIYAWARNTLHYGGHSDRSDWRQTAYTMLTEGKGDCYGYFAVTKLFFEQLEIPTIDVQKVKNSEEDSDHFWSLVSVDGGEHYYHFDATPRLGDGDDFCLVTDAFLDAYSESHKNSHNRDKSLYPATPEESL